jgi:hypothetical protein
MSVALTESPPRKGIDHPIVGGKHHKKGRNDRPESFRCFQKTDENCLQPKFLTIELPFVSSRTLDFRGTCPTAKVLPAVCFAL